MAVDTLGLLWAVMVVPADVQDRDGGIPLVEPTMSSSEAFIKVARIHLMIRRLKR